MNEIQSDNLAEVLKENSKTIVLFGASWCGACRLVKPKLAGLAEKNSDINFVYVDAEKYPQSRGLADVQNLPTIAGYNSDSLTIQKVGSKDENIQEVINEVASH